MWAVADLEKTRVLLDGGADVNARRTTFELHSWSPPAPRGAAVVKLLLDRGAKPNPNTPRDESSPLIEAAIAGDLATLEMLIERGVDVKAFGGGPAFVLAATERLLEMRGYFGRQESEPFSIHGSLPDDRLSRPTWFLYA